MPSNDQILITNRVIAYSSDWLTTVVNSSTTVINSSTTMVDGSPIVDGSPHNNLATIIREYRPSTRAEKAQIASAYSLISSNFSSLLSEADVDKFLKSVRIPLDKRKEVIKCLKKMGYIETSAREDFRQALEEVRQSVFNEIENIIVSLSSTSVYMPFSLFLVSFFLAVFFSTLFRGDVLCNEA
jgi:hypothetical protein